MKTQPTQVFTIPSEDSKFLLLPDNQEASFFDLGALRNHVQNEIAAWTNIENTIAKKYQLVWGKIETVSKTAKNGCLAIGSLSEIKKLLTEWTITGSGINSCIMSRSRLGRYITELRNRKRTPQEFHDCCMIAIGVLGYPCSNWSISSNILSLVFEAARVAKHFACPEDLSKRVEEYKEHLESLTNSAREQRKDYELRMSQFDKDIDNFKQKQSAELSKNETEYVERIKQADLNLKALNDAYSKKLQLEAPAQYWRKLSRFYLGWGWGLLVFSLVLGSITAKELLWLLVHADTITILNETQISLSSIRASLILIATTSIAGYLIHLIVKLAISCFHLSRDYRERFQLTNVFLALLRDGDIKCDDQIKQIVMQSLFSRSDTGLLKGEHSFVMPGVSELLKQN